MSGFSQQTGLTTCLKILTFGRPSSEFFPGLHKNIHRYHVVIVKSICVNLVSGAYAVNKTYDLLTYYSFGLQACELWTLSFRQGTKFLFSLLQRVLWKN